MTNQITYRIYFVSVVLILQISCGRDSQVRTALGIDYANMELRKALTDTTRKQILVDTLIKDKETAITLSESILFKIYGKDNIINQRPYEIYNIDGYWFLSGTLPKGMLGGTFLIIINASTGQVIKMAHSK